MRSLKYASVFLPLQFLNVVGSKVADPEADTTVVVTTTRTVTFCPITDLFTCEAPEPTEYWSDWGKEKTTTEVSTTTTGDYSTTTSHPYDGTTTTSHPYDGTTTTTHSGEGTTTTTHSGEGTTTTTTTTTAGEGSTTTTTTAGEGSTTTTTTAGEGSTTTTTTGEGSTTTTTTTTAGEGTTTTTTLTTTTTGGFGNGTTTTTTTTSACDATHTASPTLEAETCNGELTRAKWCDSKSIISDTHDDYRSGETKTFTLRITKENIARDGKPEEVFAINGKTPGEAIEVNWGDLVEITVFNDLPDNLTTIHWHGIRQYGTNDQDGVPGVTECGLAPGASRKYTWLASTYGTGWYHSHALSQYGGGIRGPIIIHGPASANYDLDSGSVMIDEKWDRTIFQMAYTIARTPGQLPAATNYLLNGINKSPNGTLGESAKWIVKAGKKHLFRIINSSAQSAFAVHFDNHKMTVISADFTPIVPYETEWLWIQSGQRYNVIVEMNQPSGAYYLRAATQVGCGVRNANTGLVGTSHGIIEYEDACGVVPTASNATVTLTGCKDEPLASLIPVVPKTAGSLVEFTNNVALLPGGNAGVQAFAGVGPIVRWFFGGPDALSTNSATKLGNKTINVDFDQPTLKSLATLGNDNLNSTIYSNAVVLDGAPSEWVYFVIQNNFQTSHPMHLHGHDFSVLGQGQGVFTQDMVGTLNFGNTIRRDTVLLFGAPQGAPGPNVPVVPGYTVIGFETDNPGAWVMHCHIMWHADAGMALQFIEQPESINAGKYYNSQPFQDECAAVTAWGQEGKEVYESGLKRREAHLAGHKFHGARHAMSEYSY